MRVAGRQKGAKIKPYTATKSRSFMAKAGKMPAVVAIVPARTVAFDIDSFGKIA